MKAYDPSAYRNQRQPINHGIHPTAKFLFEEATRQRVAISWIRERAGLGDRVLNDWKRGVQPTIFNLEAALNVLGFTITVTPLNRDTTSD